MFDTEPGRLSRGAETGASQPMNPTIFILEDDPDIAILGLGRALGETMAVTMVIGNNPAIAKSLLAPGYTMASVIANEFNEATSDLHRSALIEIGLALFLVTIIVNILAGLMVWTVTRGTPARSNA